MGGWEAGRGRCHDRCHETRTAQGVSEAGVTAAEEGRGGVCVCGGGQRAAAAARASSGRRRRRRGADRRHRIDVGPQLDDLRVDDHKVLRQAAHLERTCSIQCSQATATRVPFSVPRQNSSGRRSDQLLPSQAKRRAAQCIPVDIYKEMINPVYSIDMASLWSRRSSLRPARVLLLHRADLPPRPRNLRRPRPRRRPRPSWRPQAPPPGSGSAAAASAPEPAVKNSPHGPSTAGSRRPAPASSVCGGNPARPQRRQQQWRQQ